MLDTPVLFLIFNRPDTTVQVFEQIRKVKPKHLFIAADGARLQKNGDAERCEHARKIVTDGIDWNCEVQLLFRDENLGCGRAVSEGITWFFEHVDYGIILEDDTVPDTSFFYFCEQLLLRYSQEESVMHIGGNNYFNKDNKESYYFSFYAHPPHGWATWKRAWKHYDFKMQNPSLSILESKLKSIIQNQEVESFWMEAFVAMREKDVDTWDTQWQFAIWSQNGCTIMPYKNLVKNIGYHADATHTTNPGHRSNISVFYSIDLAAIRHPTEISVHAKYDNYKIEYIYLNKPTLRDKINAVVPKPIKNVFKRLLFL